MKRQPDLDQKDRALLEAARKARRRAHAPYSGFKVGAAIRTKAGELFTGCNVENASLGAGICAERNAIWHAVAEGMRPGDLETVSIYTRDDEPTPPCGACLQVLVEFGRDLQILSSNGRRTKRYRLDELLPVPFTHYPERKT